MLPLAGHIDAKSKDNTQHSTLCSRGWRRTRTTFRVYPRLTFECFEVLLTGVSDLIPHGF